MTKVFDDIYVFVAGEMACWATPDRPSFDSYSFPPRPSIKGLIEAIYWKPEIRYNIKECMVLNKPRFVDIKKSTVRKAKPNGFSNYSYLINPAYCVRFNIEYVDSNRNVFEDDDYSFQMKHREILRRKIENNEPFKDLFMGKSECRVHKYELCSGYEEAIAKAKAINQFETFFININENSVLAYEVDYLRGKSSVKVVNKLVSYAVNGNIVIYNKENK